MGNQNQAGIPQAVPSSGGLPIGALQGMPVSGVMQRLGDRSLWLRTGSIIAKALAPLGQLCEYLRAHIFTESASAAHSAGSPMFCCTNGLGTYVVGFGNNDATNVYVSNDYGVTWTARAHNMTNSSGPCCMVWTGSNFVGGNSTSSVFLACTSADGITWAASTTSVTSGGTLTPNSAKIAWSGSVVAMTATANTGANGTCTSPTGLTGTWTGRTNAINSNIQFDGSPHGFILQGGTSIVTGDPTGVTWTGRSPGTIVSAAKPMAFADKFVLFQASGLTIQSTDNGATWSAPAAMGVDMPSYGFMNKTNTGRVYGTSASNSQIVYTDDGVFWKAQGFAIANPASVYPAVLNSMITTDGARSTVLVNNEATPRKVQYSAGSFNASNGVGSGVLYTSGSGGVNLFSKVG